MILTCCRLSTDGFEASSITSFVANSVSYFNSLIYRHSPVHWLYVSNCFSPDVAAVLAAWCQSCFCLVRARLVQQRACVTLVQLKMPSLTVCEIVCLRKSPCRSFGVIQTLVRAVHHFGDVAAMRGKLPSLWCCETFGFLDAVVHVHYLVGVYRKDIAVAALHHCVGFQPLVRAVPSFMVLRNGRKCWFQLFTVLMLQHPRLRSLPS